MKFCEKCSIEYEPGDTCMCAIFNGWMQEGETNLVPMRWKLEYWDGYPNAVKYCDHSDADEWMDGSQKCKLCGLEIEAPEEE